MAATNENDEEYDSFLTADGVGGGFIFDSDSLAVVRGTSRATGGGASSRASRSAATTQLASDVGSVIGAKKNPFLKSITFFDPKVYYRKTGVASATADQTKKDGEEDPTGDEIGGRSSTLNDNGIDQQTTDNDDNDSEENNINSHDDMTFEINDLTHWEILLTDPPIQEMISYKKRRRAKCKSKMLGKLLLSNKVIKNKKTKRPQLIIDDFEGLVEFSSVQSGDRLVSINKKKIKPEEYSAVEAMVYMRECIVNDGVLHVTTENPQGQDTAINVTVIKPRLDMDYEELGLLVWNWPYLCVRQIKPNSIFRHTAIQNQDQVAAINDIDCSTMREEAFAKCVLELPMEITITLIRRKHRYTGSYS